MIPICVKVGCHFQKVTGDSRSSLTVSLQVTSIAIEQSLIDALEIDRTKFGMDELEEAAGPIEDLSHTGRRQLLTVARDIGI